jgi:hypothetical protein
MAFSYAGNVRSSRLVVVKDAIDAGSGAAKLKVYTTSYGTLLCTFTLNDPCGTIDNVNWKLNFSGMPKNSTPVANGNAAIAKITTSADDDVISGLTVGTVGTDLTVSSVAFQTSKSVTLEELSIQG